MSAGDVVTQLQGQLLHIRSVLHAGNFTEVETLVSAYQSKVKDSLGATAGRVSRQQFLQLQQLHTSVMAEMRVLRDEASDWLRQRRRASAAIEAYNRSYRRLLF